MPIWWNLTFILVHIVVCIAQVNVRTTESESFAIFAVRPGYLAFSVASNARRGTPKGTRIRRAECIASTHTHTHAVHWNIATRVVKRSIFGATTTAHMCRAPRTAPTTMFTLHLPTYMYYICMHPRNIYTIQYSAARLFLLVCINIWITKHKETRGMLVWWIHLNVPYIKRMSLYLSGSFTDFSLFDNRCSI